MQTEVYLMFPTAVSSHHFDRHKEIKEIFLRRMPEHCATHESGGIYSGEASGHVYVHTDDHLKDLFKFIADGVRAHLDIIAFDYSRVDVNIIKTWISVTDTKTVTPVHAHATSHLSFVYYMQMPENADGLGFQIQKNPNEIFYGAFSPGSQRQKSLVHEYNNLNANQHVVKSQEGQLLIFPSDLAHGTVKFGDMGSTQRIALAGDVLLVFNEEMPNYATGVFNPASWRRF
jgi:uncharacterized protein (TIGR02466 family)